MRISLGKTLTGTQRNNVQTSELHVTQSSSHIKLAITHPTKLVVGLPIPFSKLMLSGNQRVTWIPAYKILLGGNT
jgi:hypothetical protein